MIRNAAGCGGVEGEKPLKSILDWAGPTDKFVLFEGEIKYTAEDETTSARLGRVELILRSGSHLLWTVDLPHQSSPDYELWTCKVPRGESWIEFDFLGETTRLPAHRTSSGRGFITRSSASDGNRTIKRVMAHWVNLPHIAFGEMLREDLPDGRWSTWGGRNEVDLGEWRCRFDERRSLSELYRESKYDYLHLTTHVMEIEKKDGSLFNAGEAEHFLTGMQFGMSFAMSRWVAPLLPVGFYANDEIAWSSWLPLHIDPPGLGSGKWWVEHRPQDLWSFLRLWMERWNQETENQPLKFLVTSALASGEGAFVEQRLMTTLAAIEQLSWLTEIVHGNRTEQSWRSKNASWRIRRLLRTANVPAQTGPTTPALTAFPATRDRDGPAAISHIRDSLTHPKSTEDLYAVPGLIAEAARLARRYLDLLLLHHIGYCGFAADRTRLTGWVGESEQVPWIASSPTVEGT